MTTTEEMAKLPMHSKEWFTAAFENCTATATSQQAAEFICKAYNICGQADPAYIANVIEGYKSKIK